MYVCTRRADVPSSRKKEFFEYLPAFDRISASSVFNVVGKFGFLNNWRTEKRIFSFSLTSKQSRCPHLSFSCCSFSVVTQKARRDAVGSRSIYCIYSLSAHAHRVAIHSVCYLRINERPVNAARMERMRVTMQSISTPYRVSFSSTALINRQCHGEEKR